MKKLSMLAVAFTAIVFASCGNKTAQTTATADSVKSFEQEQIEASIKMNLDSLASVLGNLKQLPVTKNEEGKIVLSKEEKQVKPDFLLDPAVAENAATLAEKYRTLAALQVDKQIALLYELATDDYDKAITKLAADINDPSFKAIEDEGSLYEATETLYNAMNANSRINYFWQMAASSLVEQLYITSQKTDTFIASFDDDAAANATYRIVLLLDAINRLSEFDPEIAAVATALKPLDVLNATTVAEFKDQLTTANEQIKQARAALIK